MSYDLTLKITRNLFGILDYYSYVYYVIKRYI
jgi:hypothetical protein